MKALTKGIAKQPNSKKRLKLLVKKWGFRLPLASAILAILYPKDFTVYDSRVCEALDDFKSLAYTQNFETLWSRYENFKRRVDKTDHPGLESLRDKDRYLWGKSFHHQLEEDVKRPFKK